MIEEISKSRVIVQEYYLTTGVEVNGKLQISTEDFLDRNFKLVPQRTLSKLPPEGRYQ